jgi:ATP-binding cassette subfamily C protein
MCISPVLGLITILGLLFAASFRSAAIKKSYGLGLLTVQRNKVVQSVVANSLDSLRLIKAHDASQTWVHKLSDAFNDARTAQFSQTKHSAALSAGWTIGTAVAASAIILLSVWMGVPGAALVLFLVIVARLNGQLQGLVTSLGILAYCLPAVRELAHLNRTAVDSIEVNPDLRSTRTELIVHPGDPLLTFTNVGYSYFPTDRGVSGMSFDVIAGQITALSGPSGSGKSTLADVALGLLTPQTGSVNVAGTPLAEADLTWWRSHVAYVPQHIQLIPGTLRENLIWSISGAVSDDQCWEALRQAEAHFAVTLPQGLDTPLGDSGQHLSGGERQRIALARALLRKPLLLVLDEATSALDHDTESAVMDMARSLLPAITVLLISHRASTLATVENIVRLSPANRESVSGTP